MVDNLNLVLNLIPHLLRGGLITVEVTIASLLIGLIAGVLLGVLRVYGPRLISTSAALYSMLVRSIPPVVSLFILFFVIARIVDLSPLLSGIFALGLSSSAYQSEIVRGAIQSVGPSQMAAARAIGMTRTQAIRHIILPQALRLAIPPWSNEAAIILKNSSLVYLLGIAEILRQAQYVAARTLEPFLAFGSAAALYFVLFLLANRGLSYLERHLSLPA